MVVNYFTHLGALSASAIKNALLIVTFVIFVGATTSIPGRAFANPVPDQCDLLASDPMDAERVAPAIDSMDVDVGAAIAACESSLQANPDNQRHEYQLIRAQIIGKIDEKFPAGGVLQRLNALADSKYIGAINLRASLYRDGSLVPRDRKKALTLFRQSSDLTDKYGIVSVGWLLASGVGGQEDRNLGMSRLKEAAEAGNTEAVYLYGLALSIFYGDNTTAVTWLERAAADGEVNALHQLYLIYSAPGREFDRKLAIDRLEKAVAAGNIKSIFHWGIEVSHGVSRVFRQDKALARKIFENLLRFLDTKNGVSQLKPLVAKQIKRLQ